MIVHETLKRTPLFDIHVSLKAKMVPFGGWEMPLQYADAGILAEYESTRRKVAVFDTSHMGEFLVEGDAQKSGLDRIVTQAVKDMPVKTCRYGACLNEQGGVIDDLIVFRIKEDKWFIVVNGATTAKDAAHFMKHITAPGKFKDISSQIGKLDVQGPLSRDVLKPLIKGIERLEYYTFDEFDVLGEKVIVSRTGYTGELGYEIYFPWNKISELWREIFKDKRVKPAGLGARDVLRLEMGYSLYGHELLENIAPLEAGLKKFVDFKKDFIGKEILVEQEKRGIPRKLVAFRAENRRSPRAEQKIFSTDSQEIGIVTSGTFSPALTRGIGLGFVAGEYAQVGKKILVGDQKDTIPAEITARPFYENGTLKN